eukprot:7389645-Prymnesium_polylepis.1
MFRGERAKPVKQAGLASGNQTSQQTWRASSPRNQASRQPWRNRLQRAHVAAIDEGLRRCGAVDATAERLVG